MVLISSSGPTSRPSPFHEISPFWQKRQWGLQNEKKTVPDPRRPRSTSSSPWCGKAAWTRTRAPVRQRAPVACTSRFTRQRLAHSSHWASASVARRARSASSPVRARRR